MAATPDSIETFLQFYRRHIVNGEDQSERSQGAPFLEAFFRAFGHEGTNQAGARLEPAVPGAGRRGRTGYADLYWPRGSVVVELKRRSERRLDRHYGQVWDYVSHLNPSPRYAVLCNFDEFWIYDFEQAIGTPVDKIRTEEIGFHLDAFRFMEGGVREPLFRDGQIVEVTQAAAENMGELYQSLHHRSQSPSTYFNERDAQRFVLQCVLALFSEYRQLLPEKAFSEAVKKCLPPQPESTYDILCKGLFREMNEAGQTPYGRFQGVRYFNGGLFAKLPPIELKKQELLTLDRATRHNWSKVRPAIFGSIFEATLNSGDRHTEGIHFTSENDIMKIVRPTIGQYWEERIEATHNLADLNALHLEMQRYRILDPACGSGNFLYMAYQELKQVEQLLIDKIFEQEQDQTAQTRRLSGINLEQQFFGLDRNAFAVELARVTLSIARKVAVDSLGLDEAVLPLDMLDRNIVRCDALEIDEWPSADAIIGNPPFQSKNKMQREFGADYVRALRERYPDIPGRADYCVYWFRRAHDRLSPGGRAGLVGTNTIRQNYSRQGGLDYIVETGGTIFNAVSSQVWSGEAAVHVSLVNWVKGEYNAPKKLATQLGDSRESPWRYEENIASINSALSSGLDVSQAQTLAVNRSVKCCYQGQTHGHDGFLLEIATAQTVDWDHKSLSVIHPYLNANELLGTIGGQPTRYVIDLSTIKTEKTAKTYTSAYAVIRDRVLPQMRQNAQQERQSTNKK
ncbi:MAG: class I SAM-dependent DNA methyltransferase, partial [Oscillatoriales cyanobacterium]